MGLSTLLKSKDSLSVTFLEDVIYVSPPAEAAAPSADLQEPTTHDPVLRGQVRLVVASPRRARKIRVELVGRATRHGGDGSHSYVVHYEQSVTLEKSLEIDLGNERLDRGTHTWDFSFIIPSSTAVSERSVYGTVRHLVRATIHGSGSFRDLSSMPKPVWLIANPAAPGELPSGLEVDVRHPASELGPIALHISSPHLTVASLLFLGVTFEQPPEGMKVMSVQAFVRQDFEIHYKNKDLGIQYPPVQRKLLFFADSTTPVPTSAEDLLDRSNLSRGAPPPLAYEPRSFFPQPLARLEGGKDWTYARVTRIPDDDSVRPTTLEGTDTPIRVKHQLVCQIKYRFKGSKKDQILEMATNVTIASCCCLTSSLLLPAYRTRSHLAAHHPSSHASSSGRSQSCSAHSRAPPSSPELDSLRAAVGGSPVGVDSPTGSITPFHRRCLCNTPLQKLVDQEGEKLAGAAESRSRSRAGGSGSGSASASRSQSRQRLNDAGSDDDGEAGSGADGEDERGRDGRRRKIGETYAPEYAFEDVSSVPAATVRGPLPRAGTGASWTGQAAALRPAAGRQRAWTVAR
ncbi:hypothetical protein JCM10207_006572 [Rhodosporidiobolus poonsookiae]